MVLSRFWTLLLTGVAVVGIATALLAASLVNESWERAATNDLIRDRFEVEAILKLDARARLDAIAPIAANSDVRTALRRAGARRDRRTVDEELSDGLRTKLGELNGQLEELRGDLLFAVDDEGWIVAAVAPGTIPDGAGLGQFPMVRRALEGHVRDGVWVYNDGVYRMAARPVIEGGQYVGALVHGKRFDDALAERLSNRLDGASVGFFQGDSMFASYMPTGVQSAPTRDNMAAPLGDALGDEGLASGSRTEPLALPTGGLAVYSLVTGGARHASVGYAIARPVRTLAQPWELMDHASGDAWAALPWPYLGGGGVLIFLITMFLFWLERDRPLSKLLRASKALRAAPENRFTITDFGGRYRKISSEVNEALDQVAQAGGAAAPRKSANLDEILGPTAEAQPGSGSFFGFAGDENAGQPAPEFAPIGGGDAPAAASPIAGAPPPLGTAAGPVATAPLGSPPPAAGAPPPPPRPPAPRPPPDEPATSVMADPKPPLPRPPAPPLPGGLAAPTEEDATAISAPPPVSSRKQLKSTLLGVAPPKYDEEDEDGATMVARVPQELLDATSGGDADESAHFRDVYEKFVSTKKQCGESTAGLTFEKFSQTLRKNRDQIVKRHGARKVRFTVYTKNGKAALKATPIKQ